MRSAPRAAIEAFQHDEALAVVRVWGDVARLPHIRTSIPNAETCASLPRGVECYDGQVDRGPIANSWTS